MFGLLVFTAGFFLSAAVITKGIKFDCIIVQWSIVVPWKKKKLKY